MQVTSQFIQKVQSAFLTGPLGQNELRRIEGLGHLYLGQQNIAVEGYSWIMECTIDEQPVCIYQKW